jgi:GT2 family glycosyltransferase
MSSDMNQNAFVSVVVLSFNHQDFIERALRSVIFQTFRDFEIIFIDNNSADQSFERGLAVLQESGVRFHAEKTVKNLGISLGFNHAITTYASGTYLATLAGDDWWDMDNLKYKVEYANSHPEYGMVYGNGYNFDHETEEITIFYRQPSVSGDVLREFLKAPNINPQGILYKHELVKSLGYFDPAAKVEDRDLWYRIAAVAKIGYVHKPLTFYRVNHGGNISSNIEYMREGNEYFFRKYEKDYPKEIRLARTRQYQFFAYKLAEGSPSIGSLKYMIKNYQFDWLYNKQIIKCILNIIRGK